MHISKKSYDDATIMSLKIGSAGLLKCRIKWDETVACVTGYELICFSNSVHNSPSILFN